MPDNSKESAALQAFNPFSEIDLESPKSESPKIPLSKKSVNVVKVPSVIQHDNAPISFIDLGEDFAESRWMLHTPKINIIRLPGNQYKNPITGEVREMVKRDGKDNHNLRVTFDNLQRLIRTNFSSGGQNQIMLTLTYAHHERNPYTAKEDFEIFWKRVKRRYPDHKLSYICVIEPQGSGRWHFHVMIKSDKRELWVDKWEIKKVWGKGNAYVERLKSNDVGMYYIAYFTKLNYEQEPGPSANFEQVLKAAKAQLEAEEKIHDPDAPKKERMKLTKKQIKGQRLKYYPQGLKFYTCTRDIIYPKRRKTTQKEANEAGKVIYSRRIEIRDDQGELLNIIQKDTIRKNKPGQPKGTQPKSSPPNPDPPLTGGF